MSVSPIIEPESDKPLGPYHQKLSWKIGEETWNRNEYLVLQLKTQIPGSYSVQAHNYNLLGGAVLISKNAIVFRTMWPKDVDCEKISINAVFSIKLDDASSVDIKCDQRKSCEFANYCGVSVSRNVTIKPELIYDEERSFTLEAELKIETNGRDKEHFKNPSAFVKDMQSIFHDEKNSDFVVIAGNENFHCHKNILTARSEILKKMLTSDTLESKTNTIEVKEVPAEAVKSMLKYIYSGEIPDDPELLTIDLLNVADMYLLDSLKKACLESLIERLDVSSCILTFIMADRYLPHDGKLREMVIKLIKFKAEEVVEMEDWDKLVDNHPSIAKELMRAIVNGSKEKHKCQFCVVSYK